MITQLIFTLGLVTLTFTTGSQCLGQEAQPTVEATPQTQAPSPAQVNLPASPQPLPQVLRPAPPPSTVSPTPIATPPPGIATPPVTQQLPVVTPVEVDTAPTAYSYYCDRTKSYFPAVSQCPEGWIAVPINVPPSVTLQPSVPQPVYEPIPVWSPWSNRVSDAVNARTNALTLELFGRANYYSLNYDHALSTRWSLGVGASYWSQSYHWATYTTDVTVVPVYANYYFSDRRDRGYVSFGAQYIQGTQPANVAYNNNIYLSDTVAGDVGIGYEFRYDGGFLVRIAAYLIGNQSTVNFNPGVSLGFTF